MLSRNPTIDSFRAIAAIGVVMAHVEDGTWWDTSQAFIRWIIPFFLMVTGYFTNFSDIDPARLLSRCGRLTRLFVWSCILFLPLYLTGTSQGQLNISVLLLGTSYHLWYLTSLLVGVLLVAGLVNYPRLATAISVGILIANVVLGFIYAENPFTSETVILFKWLLCIPFLWFGFRLRSLENPSWKIGAALTALGTLIASFECNVPWGQYVPREFYGGAIVSCFGIMLIAMDPRIRIGGPLADFGRDHSLTLYIIHPLAISVVLQSIRFIGLELPAPAIFVLTLIGSVIGIFLITRIKILRQLFNGDRLQDIFGPRTAPSPAE